MVKAKYYSSIKVKVHVFPLYSDVYRMEMEPIISDGCVDLENVSPWREGKGLSKELTDVDNCFGRPFPSL